MNSSATHPIHSLICILTFVLVFNLQAIGQGTSETLPDPISSQKLESLLELYMELRPDQWDVLEPAHSDYLDRFKKLREGEIAEYLAWMRSLQDGGMPELEVMEQFFDRRTELVKKIVSLDNQLFTSVQAGLDESQLPALPRVRNARSRQRSMQGMTGMFSGIQQVDLSVSMMSQDWGPEVRERIDAILIPYEAKLTKLAEQMSIASTRQMIDMVTILNESGFGDIDNEELMENPDRMTEFMEQMNIAMRQSGAKTRELGAEIRKLNRRTYRQLATSVDREDRRTLAKGFLQQGYPFLWGIISDDEIVGAFNLAEAEQLDPEQVEMIDSIRIDYEDKLAVVINRMMDKSDAMSDERDAFDYERYQDLSDNLSEDMEKVQSLRTAVYQQLVAVVGHDLKKDSQGVEQEQAITTDDGVVVSTEAALAIGTTGITPYDNVTTYIPRPMTVVEIARLKRLLQLDESRAAILDSLHSDYLQAYAESVGTLRALSVKEAAAIWSTTGEEEFAYVGDPKVLAASFDAASKAVHAARIIDAQFFFDVLETVAGEESEDLIVMEITRRSQSLDRPGDSPEDQMTWTGLVVPVEGTIDLFEVLDRSDLSESEMEVAIEVLVRSATSLKNSAEQYVDSRMAIARSNSEFAVNFDNSSLTDRDQMAGSMARWREHMREVNRMTEDSEQARVSLLHQVRDSIIEALPPGPGGRVERAYRHVAFADVYAGDRLALEPLIQKVMKLKDLDESQKLAIDQLRAEYLPEYDGFCDQLVDLANMSPQQMFTNEDVDWQEYSRSNDQRQKIMFERDELSMRMARKLRRILNESQLQRIEGLAAYGDTGQSSMDE